MAGLVASRLARPDVLARCVAAACLGRRRQLSPCQRDAFGGAPALAQGMHVGSGIAEAACKTIVSTRAKRSGMRWTPEGIDALLPLRTSVLNRAYDSLWEQEYAA